MQNTRPDPGLFAVKHSFQIKNKLVSLADLLLTANRECMN
jgi:hypothetical protein